MTLRPIASEPKARSFSVYDLEWEPQTYKFRLGGLYDGESYESFSSVDDLLDRILTKKNRHRWFYAHAGGLADMAFILEALARRPEARVRASFSGSSAIVVRVETSQGKFTFLDSYWLLRDKLAHLAKFVGLEKTRGTYTCPDYPACGHVGRACASAPDCGCAVGPEPLCMFYAPRATLQTYNARDCEILWRAVLAFESRLLELGSDLRMTIASTALRLFRRQYLKHVIPTSPALNDRAREAYKASRVEVITPVCPAGKFHYDINSSFPYAMTKPCPGEYLGSQRTLPEGEKLYLAEATVTVPEMFLPPLAWRHHKGRIFFPTGTWRSMFSRPDLELLEEAGGRVEKLHEVLVFEPFDDLAAYATELFSLRAASKDPFTRLAYKYLLNSCYGKFGEARMKEEFWLHPASERCPHAGEHDRIDENGFVISTCVSSPFPGAVLYTSEQAVSHEHVPIAVQITSEAKRSLYHYAQPCGEDLYYMDTDGITTGHTLATGPELGALKLEKTIQESAFYYQAKLYREDEKVRGKGFPPMSPIQFQKLMDGEGMTVERMLRIREVARSRGEIVPAGTRFLKHVRRDAVAKRKLLPSGTTRPWAVEELGR